MPEISLELFQNRQSSVDHLEAGGILLGSIYQKIVRIDAISTPGGNDIRRRNYFQRNRERAQLLINQAHEYSHGKTNYLGEWHTHYQFNPKPSPLDLDEIEKTFRQSQLPLKFIVTIIVGNSDNIGDFWVAFLNENDLVSCSQIKDK